MRKGAEFCSQCGTPAATRRERSRSARPRREATAEDSGSEGAPSEFQVLDLERDLFPQSATLESREQLYEGMTLGWRPTAARQHSHYTHSSTAAIKIWRKQLPKLSKTTGLSTPANSFQEKWQVDHLWQENLIRHGQTADYASMVDDLNRDEARVADGGVFLRYPSLATCREMDRCVCFGSPFRLP